LSGFLRCRSSGAPLLDEVFEGRVTVHFARILLFPPCRIFPFCSSYYLPRSREPRQPAPEPSVIDRYDAVCPFRIPLSKIASFFLFSFGVSVAPPFVRSDTLYWRFICPFLFEVPGPFFFCKREAHPSFVRVHLPPSQRILSEVIPADGSTAFFVVLSFGRPIKMLRGLLLLFFFSLYSCAQSTSLHVFSRPPAGLISIPAIERALFPFPHGRSQPAFLDQESNIILPDDWFPFSKGT